MSISGSVVCSTCYGPGSAHLSEANVKYPGNQDFSAHFQKNTEERVLRGSSVVDGPVRQATLSQLTPGPVFPRPTPQVRLHAASASNARFYTQILGARSVSNALASLRYASLMLTLFCLLGAFLRLVRLRSQRAVALV